MGYSCLGVVLGASSGFEIWWHKLQLEKPGLGFFCQLLIERVKQMSNLCVGTR